MKDILSAWLTPTGQIIRVKDTHAKDGNLLIKERFPKANVKTLVNVIMFLEDRRWVRLTDIFKGEVKWVIQGSNSLTKKQEETILDWCMANNKNYESSIFYI